MKNYEEYSSQEHKEFSINIQNSDVMSKSTEKELKEYTNAYDKYIEFNVKFRKIVKDIEKVLKVKSVKSGVGIEEKLGCVITLKSGLKFFLYYNKSNYIMGTDVDMDTYNDSIRMRAETNVLDDIFKMHGVLA